MLADLHFLDPEMYLNFSQQLVFKTSPNLVSFPLLCCIRLEVFGVAFLDIGHDLVRQDAVLLEASAERLALNCLD